MSIAWMGKQTLKMNSLFSSLPARTDFPAVSFGVSTKLEGSLRLEFDFRHASVVASSFPVWPETKISSRWRDLLGAQLQYSYFRSQHESTVLSD
jgi:hypothetical protein